MFQRFKMIVGMNFILAVTTTTIVRNIVTLNTGNIQASVITERITSVECYYVSDYRCCCYC